MPALCLPPLPHRLLCGLVLLLLLVSCGGGAADKPPATGAAPVDLLISEVAHCNAQTAGCWVEVFNPTDAAVNLRSYSLRTHTSQAPNAVHTFALGDFTVPAQGHVVLAGNALGAAQRSAQMLWVQGSAGQLPAPQANGFVELTKNGATVDFVGFKGNVQPPLTASAWSGTGVDVGTQFLQPYGVQPASLVRPAARIRTPNTRSSADWVLVNWQTPGGPNDVAADAQDADGDGIPDSAEVPGGTFAGLPLYDMGARTGGKDIFIEVDRMDSTDAGIAPQMQSLQMVVAAFAKKGIRVHFDAGNLFAATWSPSAFNLGQAQSLVPYAPCMTMVLGVCPSSASRRLLWDWKDEFHALQRRPVFHYLLFGNSHLASGAASASGMAEIIGNDIAITMGQWGFDTADTVSRHKLINMQASTLMHELGHNLGLDHGGDSDTNQKPNYLSVMNYIYQLPGLPAAPNAADAYMRWKWEASQSGVGSVDVCSLANSPCGDPQNFVIDYSDGLGRAINEAAILEGDNIGRGATAGAFADWNGNGVQDAAPYAWDLNRDWDEYRLTDHNDWANLVFDTRPTASSQNGAALATHSPDKPRRPRVPNPVTQDRQPLAIEPALPAGFIHRLRHAR